MRSPPALRHVPSFGYASLFPLLTQLLPPGSDALGQQLALLRDESLLWSRHGLRSLATTSSLYRKYALLGFLRGLFVVGWFCASCVRGS